jgi:hypothetical protein
LSEKKTRTQDRYQDIYITPQNCAADDTQAR